MRSIDGRLTLDPIGEGAWRLCDHSFADCDADSVVAYVELRPDGQYEVTWVAHAVGTAVYSAMGDLLRDAADLLDASRTRGGTKPIPIPHRPPLAV